MELSISIVPVLRPSNRVRSDRLSDLTSETCGRRLPMEYSS